MWHKEKKLFKICIFLYRCRVQLDIIVANSRATHESGEHLYENKENGKTYIHKLPEK